MAHESESPSGMPRDPSSKIKCAQMEFDISRMTLRLEDLAQGTHGVYFEPKPANRRTPVAPDRRSFLRVSVRANREHPDRPVARAFRPTPPGLRWQRGPREARRLRIDASVDDDARLGRTRLPTAELLRSPGLRHRRSEEDDRQPTRDHRAPALSRSRFTTRRRRIPETPQTRRRRPEEQRAPPASPLTSGGAGGLALCGLNCVQAGFIVTDPVSLRRQVTLAGVSMMGEEAR